MKSICLGLLIIMGAIAGASAENYRTDINPALRYWEAIMMAQNIPQADRDQLRTNDWRSQPLPPKLGELVSGYDNEFRLLRAAAHAQVPCDWGLDLTEGPDLLLPHLAHAKWLCQVARLRMMWDLQNGRQAEARDDLLAALALGRNLPQDGTLISVLVQIAIENILISTIAENYYQFSPDTLKQIEDGFEAAPVRGTAAHAVATGERSFYKWFVRHVEEARAQHPGDEAATMTSIRATFDRVFGPNEGGTNSDRVEQLLQASGETSEGILKLLAGLPPMYDRAVAIMSLPLSEYDAAASRFSLEIKNSSNPFIGELFPALSKARSKEFATLEKLAMLRAAVEYKSRGDAGFNSVTDPAARGPFVSERFVFEGVDRGFKLKSVYAGAGYPEVMIFVEKEGAPFLLAGQHAGEPLPKPDAK
jgi:hypothetical protein